MEEPLRSPLRSPPPPYEVGEAQPFHDDPVVPDLEDIEPIQKVVQLDDAGLRFIVEEMLRNIAEDLDDLAEEDRDPEVVPGGEPDLVPPRFFNLGTNAMLFLFLICFSIYGTRVYWQYQYDNCHASVLLASFEAIHIRLKDFYHAPAPLWKVWALRKRMPEIFFPCSYYEKQLNTMNDHLVLSLENCRAGRWYTLVTSSLTHYSFLHMAGNLWTLWFYGKPIINIFGLLNFSLIYILGAISGGLLTLGTDRAIEKIGGEWWRPRSAIGASDSIAALMVVLALAAPYHRVPLIPFVPPVRFLRSLAWIDVGGFVLFTIGAMIWLGAGNCSRFAFRRFLSGLLLLVTCVKLA